MRCSTTPSLVTTEACACGAGSSASLHVIAEAMKLAFADRAAYLGDPDFVDVPVDRLISKDYAARQRARINPAWYRRAPWTWGRGETAIQVRGAGLPANDSGTTHLSVSDAARDLLGEVALRVAVLEPLRLERGKHLLGRVRVPEGGAGPENVHHRP